MVLPGEWRDLDLMAKIHCIAATRNSSNQKAVSRMHLVQEETCRPGRTSRCKTQQLLSKRRVRGTRSARQQARVFGGGKVSGEEWGQVDSARRPGCSFVPPTVTNSKVYKSKLQRQCAVAWAQPPPTPPRSAGTWLAAAVQAPPRFLQHQQWEERLKTSRNPRNIYRSVTSRSTQMTTSACRLSVYRAGATTGY